MSHLFRVDRHILYLRHSFRVRHMYAFKHERLSLDGPAFWLLRLFRGGDSNIECEIVQAWFHSESTISYKVLSYTWGGTEMSKAITINGKSMGVTESFYLAPQHLRLRYADQILWIDALCIDQGNEKERGH
jgi:hypothetical protein